MTSKQTILVTGGTGKSGRRVASALAGQGHLPRVASRGGEGGLKFDWLDPATFDLASRDITSAYLLAPSGVFDLLPAMRPFIDHLLNKGVGRLVLLSGSTVDRDGPLMGPVHAYIADHAPSWTVLRASWWFENFSEQQHRATIVQEDAIYSATGDGRVAFISAEDIAAVAAAVLTDVDYPSGDLILTGPESLSHDEVAGMISESVGRTITHHKLSVAKLSDRIQKMMGLPADYATLLAELDGELAGKAEPTTDVVATLTGRKPRRFADFVRDAGVVWRKG
ncbi:ergot alkaloid biosynthesis protein [Sphingomonas sp. CL5.1]|uniref:ergot alkaloid biosynthesis protein n=1 Tax=Sphingomonas sp. CL5.1 TaxID=2653203 RepID=UPI0015839B11|nr:ergot alkaloid biosynthesis protein [Sphingomonas sp. CL5.1]QKR99902.1 ergot alkaloid biosynthesis protein [Sphingomonas sp. CL5.1]